MVFDQSLKNFDLWNKLGTLKLKANFSHSIKVLYYGKSSYQIANRLICLFTKKLKVDMSVYYTGFKTSTYFQLKCSTHVALLSNVVYKFDCLNSANCSCNSMTTRHLATRAHEHLHSTITKLTITEHLKVCESCRKIAT